jgi:hypothetical protein
VAGIALLAVTIIIIIIIILEVTAFIFHARGITIISKLIITRQPTHIAGTGQHPTLAGIDRHTTTIIRLITADGAATTVATTTTTAGMVGMADMDGNGKLSKNLNMS